MKMKHLALPLLAGITLIAVFFIIRSSINDQKLETLDITFKGKASRSIQGALEYYAMIKGDFQTGEIDPNLVSLAHSQAEIIKQQRSSGLNLSWVSRGPDNIGGRTRALVIDKDNPQILYAGGVSGGVYKSVNKGTTWARKTYSARVGGLIVSCMDQASDGTLYFGTGEGYFNMMSGPDGNLVSGSRGGGLYKSTNKGEDWEFIISTDPTIPGNTRWYNVQSVKVDPKNPNTIYAATQAGFMKSTDAGNTWVRLDMPDGGTIQTFIDIAISPDGNTIFTASYSAGRCKLYRSINAGGEFKIATTEALITNTTRLTLAIAPSNPSYVYVCAASNGTSPHPGAHSFGGLFQSKDNGDSWKQVVPGATEAEPFGRAGHYQGQYDNCVAVDPGNPERVFVGGVYFYLYNNGQWYKIASSEEFLDNANMYKNPYHAHVDFHNIVFDTKSNPKRMYLATDGGIYVSENYNVTYPFYKELNLNYITTQFYAMAVSSRGDIVGGTQDQGSIRIEYLGITGNSGKNILGGDGFYSEISAVDPNIYFFESQYGNLYRSFNAAVIGSERMTIPYSTEIDGGTNRQTYYNFNTPFRLWDKLEPKIVDPCCNSLLVLDSCVYNPAGYWACTFNSNCNLFNCFDNFPIHAKLYSSTTQFLADISIIALDSLSSTKYLINIAPGYTPEKGMKIELTPQVHVSKFFMATKSEIWMTPNATEESSDTFKWFRLAQGLQQVISMAYTSDGGTLFVGTRSSTGGRLYRITGLNQPIWFDSSGAFTPESFGITTNIIGSWSNQVVTGVSVSPSNDDVVVITLGNYVFNRDHIYLTLNAHDSAASVLWKSIHGNLPNAPAYSAVINSQSSNQDTIIVATELGIYATFDGGDEWFEENKGMDRAPVFMLRQLKKHSWSNAFTIYAATHGMGFFETNTLVSTSIEEQDKQYKAKLSVFPNPAVNNVNMKYILNNGNNLNGFVYNLNGQIVKRFDVKNNIKGENQTWINVSDLRAGTYIIRLIGEDTDISNKMIIVR